MSRTLPRQFLRDELEVARGAVGRIQLQRPVEVGDGRVAAFQDQFGPASEIERDVVARGYGERAAEILNGRLVAFLKESGLFPC